MSVVKLPEIPAGLYLEDYVAAFLQCGGFYTEKSLVESGETQVMELDIMAWKPADQPPQHALFEVKGGDWGFSDIFKPESTEGRPLGQPLKKPEGAPLNLG